MRRVDGMTPAVARLMAIADGSLTRAEVAARLGYKRNGLAATIYQARLQGGSPRFRNGSGNIAFGVKVGVVRLPQDVLHWFQAEIPEGASAADLVRALIVDAYHEDIAPPVQGEVP